ncbi:hypothetical protein H6P81_012660 [Aristolochia fimbriata]|uniref:Uncharacterized protein n=1 Tax=Aristolochia fimbriata TaxID=158543 RepID=A0AAV7EG32_ARIFI|nr:hypothetical protein H6P81_012660 [Aristolochia fimbriata]
MKVREQLAIRAKQFAITKMKAKDYEGAWSMLQQAKNYFPALEYLPQMLAVCNILWAANPTLPVYGIDWRSLLKIRPYSDKANVRFQFRELILCIEPIKKSFPGTEWVLEVLNDVMAQLSDQATKSKKNDPGTSCMSPPDGISGAGVAMEEKKVFSHKLNASTDNNYSQSFSGHTPVTSVKVDKYEGKSSSSKKKRKLNSDTSICYARRIARNATTRKNLATSLQSATNSKLPLQTRDSVQVVLGLPVCQTMASINSNIYEDDEGPQIDYLKNAGDPAVGINCYLALEALSDLEKNNRNGTADGAAVSQLERWFSPEFRAVKASLFASMPQNPHYHALLEYSSEVHEAMIIGLEFGFVCLCERIQELAFQNFKFSVDSFHRQLAVFEKMGYDVQKLKTRLYTLSLLVDRGEVLLDTTKKLETDVKETEIEIETSEAKISTLSSRILMLQSEIKTLKQEMHASEILMTSQKSNVENLRSSVRQLVEDSANTLTKFASVARSPW